MFLGTLQSHTAALELTRESKEPAEQIATRELEVDRIEGARLRAQNLHADVVAAIEVEA